jgi:deoxyadenosine/deoxycytidine kinase
MTASDSPGGEKPLLIGVVGPCGAGKSTLTNALDALGYRTRHIAQEHSYVKDMWKRLTNPDVLVFLQASYPVASQRRSLDWTEADYLEQQRRLSHAREHADLFINTDPLDPKQVLAQVLAFLQSEK